jgi:hypothetical protein
MWRWFYTNISLTWIGVLQKLVKSYNSTYHRSIAMAPISVNKQNETQVWMRLYSGRTPETIDIAHQKKPKFNTGDAVRISNAPRLFRKGYKSSWSEEVYIITARAIKHNPHMYHIRDMNGEEIKGLFHEYELQSVPQSQRLYRIEKVLKTVRRRNKIRCQVKWVGCDTLGWIDQESLRKV